MLVKFILAILLIIIIVALAYFATLVAYIRNDYIRYHRNILKHNPTYLEFLRHCTSSRQNILLTLRFNYSQTTAIEDTNYPQIAANIVASRILSDIFTTKHLDAHSVKSANNYTKHDLVFITCSLIARHFMNKEDRRKYSYQFSHMTELSLYLWEHNTKATDTSDMLTLIEEHCYDAVIDSVTDNEILNLCYVLSYRYLTQFERLSEWEYDLNDEDLIRIRAQLPTLVFGELLNTIRRTKESYLYASP